MPVMKLEIIFLKRCIALRSPINTELLHSGNIRTKFIFNFRKKFSIFFCSRIYVVMKQVRVHSAYTP